MPFPLMGGVQDLCLDHSRPSALEKRWQRATSSLVLLRRRKVEWKSNVGTRANEDFCFYWKWWRNSAYALCFGLKAVGNVAEFFKELSVLFHHVRSPKPLEGPKVRQNALGWPVGVFEKTMNRSEPRSEPSMPRILAPSGYAVANEMDRVNTITRK